VIERSFVNTRRGYEAAAAAFESSVGHLELNTAKALKKRNAP
jgi:hypothetical protein